MRRLLPNPTRLFTGRVTQALPTFFVESSLKKHFSGLVGRKGKIIMMEVCSVVSEWNPDQQADEDKKVQMQITLESANGIRTTDNRIVLWKRGTNFDLATGGGAIAENTTRDDLTITGKGEIWPAHELFFSIKTDTGTELMSGFVSGYGFLVEMNPMEALVWLRERDKGTNVFA